MVFSVSFTLSLSFLWSSLSRFRTIAMGSIFCSRNVLVFYCCYKILFCFSVVSACSDACDVPSPAMVSVVFCTVVCQQPCSIHDAVDLIDLGDDRAVYVPTGLLIGGPQLSYGV